jgi:hypothetical protein
MSTRARVSRAVSVLVLCAASIGGCASRGASAAPAALTPDRDSANAVAQRFAIALNGSDTAALARLTSSPLLFREQRWRQAVDGDGFVLGAASDTVLASDDRRVAFLRTLVGRIRIASPSPVERPPTRETLLQRELANADPRWSKLTLVLFRRGEGDVEHVAIAGVDTHSMRVAALYVN